MSGGVIDMTLQDIKISKYSHDETLFFEVHSSNGDEYYDTWYDVDHKWICSCPDYYYRKRFCKHMKACAELMNISDTMVYAEVY